MRALSIRQPWAALIVQGIKDIENRPWRTRYRGRLLVHASLGRSGSTLKDVAQFHDVPITPELTQLCGLTGGIIGEVDIVDCVSASASSWFDGSLNSKGKRNYGFVLRQSRTLPFRPMPGRLGLFDVPDIGHILDADFGGPSKLLKSLARPTGIEPVFPP